ncbi:MAG: hypothetical protein ACE5PT_07290 [Gemmatimonadales bacterium]
MSRRTTGVPSLPIPVLRAAVERELDEHSLRWIARQVQMSPNAIRNFLRGATPRRSTRVRLERWLATRPERGRGPSLNGFIRLMGQVTTGLPEREARAIGGEMSRLLLGAYQRQRLPPPRWVRELARHYSAQH